MSEDMELALDASPLARGLFFKMRDASLTMTALAARAGVRPDFIRDILRGKSKNPGYDGLEKIAKVLGCEVKDLRDQGIPGDEPKQGQFVDQPDELALLAFYRSLDFEGKKAAFTAMRDVVLTVRKPSD